MNRFNLLLSKVAFAAILLFLVSSSAFAQVTYSITGTLSLTSGTDPLGLNGKTVTATATLSQSTTPTSSTTTATSSSNSYSGVNVALSIGKLQTSCSASSEGPVTVILTDNLGAAAQDTLGIENCSLLGTATISATVTIANGNMITAVPSAITTVSLISGNITFSLSGTPPTNGSFALTSATLGATGTAAPTVTPSLTSWTPATVPVGSTTSESTQVTFTTVPSNSYDAVSFTASSSATWLTVTPAAANTFSGITLTANPTGLTQTVNTATVTLSYGTGYPTLQIPVTFNLSAVAPPTLTVPITPLTFNYTSGGTVPAAQAVSISGTSGISFTASAATTSGGSWLSVTPASGTVSTTSSASISVNTTGLAAGSYTGTVTVSSTGATGSPAAIPVTLNVTAVSLTATPSQLNFTYSIGGTQPGSQSISVGDSSNASFTATAATTSGGSWLSVTPGSGAASASLSVSVNTTGLTANTYNGTITIAATGATSQVVNVSLSVSSAAGPTISTIVSGANYSTAGFSPGTIATIFGNLLGPKNGESFQPEFKGALDSTLGGVTVTVQGTPAIPLYVSATQINLILPFN